MKEEQGKAYFEMNKNENRKLKSIDDYKNLSERALQNAMGYFEIFERCKNMVRSEHCVAVFTNMSFACELYLKSILYNQEVNCSKQHDLSKLFDKIEEINQNKIIEKYNEATMPSTKKKIEKTEFLKCLNEVSLAFIVFRYAYEKNALACDTLFLFGLLCTLKNYCEKLCICKVDESNEKGVEFRRF